MLLMKKLGWLLLAALMLVTAVMPLTAGAEEGDLLDNIKTRGFISIATEGDWSPWTYIDEETGRLTGFDVEIGQAIADGLGVDVQFQVTQWDAILAGVSAGRFDLACNGVSYTEERAKSYDFSTPYLYTPSVLVVKADNDTINSFEDLSGKKTANTISSIYATIAQDYGATVVGVDTLEQTIMELTLGRVDATINASVSIDDYLRAHPDAPIRVAAKDAGDTMVIPVRKDPSTATLVQAINEVLEQMRQDGRLAELSVKYFGGDLTNPPE